MCAPPPSMTTWPVNLTPSSRARPSPQLKAVHEQLAALSQAPGSKPKRAKEKDKRREGRPGEEKRSSKPARPGQQKKTSKKSSSSSLKYAPTVVHAQHRARSAPCTPSTVHALHFPGP